MNASKLIAVDLTDENINIKLNINSDTTVSQVIDILKSRPFYKEEITTDLYGICLKSDPTIVFSNDNKIGKAPSNEFIFRKVVKNYKIRNDKTNEQTDFGLDPLLTIKEVINFVEYCNFKSTNYSLQTRAPHENSTPKYDIILLSSGARLKMDYFRTLISYKLKNDDILCFAETRTQSKVWKDLSTNSEIPTIITSPIHKITKTFKFKLSVTFNYVIERFLLKANIKETKWFYSIYLIIGGDFHEMNSEDTLSAFPLPTPARFELKFKQRPPRNWFGVKPDTLPLVVDSQNGLLVPEILVILKDILLKTEGLEQEGIFRKAGVESEMIVLQDKIAAGECFHCSNPHNIGTLLKRWYKELPERLLNKLDRSLPEDELIQLHKYLSQFEMRLFDWLMSLLLLVVEKESKNLMEPKNCAIVWGPGMVGSNDQSSSIMGALDHFNDTGFGVSVIESNLSHLVEKKLQPYSIQSLPAQRPTTIFVDKPIIPPLSNVTNIPPGVPQRSLTPTARFASQITGFPQISFNEMLQKQQQLHKLDRSPGSLLSPPGSGRGLEKPTPPLRLDANILSPRATPPAETPPPRDSNILSPRAPPPRESNILSPRATPTCESTESIETSPSTSGETESNSPTDQAKAQPISTSASPSKPAPPPVPAKRLTRAETDPVISVAHRLVPIDMRYTNLANNAKPPPPRSRKAGVFNLNEVNELNC